MSSNKLPSDGIFFCRNPGCTKRRTRSGYRATHSKYFKLHLKHHENCAKFHEQWLSQAQQERPISYVYSSLSQYGKAMKSGYTTLQEKFKALDEREQSSSSSPMSSLQFDSTMCSVATGVDTDTESEAVTFASDHDSLLDDGIVEDVLEDHLENVLPTSIDRPRLARISTNEDAAAFCLIEILDRAIRSDRIFSEAIS